MLGFDLTINAINQNIRLDILIQEPVMVQNKQIDKQIISYLFIDKFGSKRLLYLYGKKTSRGQIKKSVA